jgi:hypothetical protein
MVSLTSGFRFGLEKTDSMKRAYHKRDWTKVDWSKKNTTIAQEMGTYLSYVSMKRKECAPHTSRSNNCVHIRRTRRITKRDWSQVDWSLNNREIGQQLGVTTEYISRSRKQHAPESIHRPLASYDATIWKLTDEQIARRTGVQLVYVQTLRSKRTGGKGRVQRNWKQIDWNRSTAELAKELEVDKSMVSRARRRCARETLRVTIPGKQHRHADREHIVVTDKLMQLQIPPPDKQRTIG